MKKTTYFLEHPGLGWPDERWLAPYFLTPAGRHEAFAIDNDCWGVSLEGVDGTENLPPQKQIDINLTIVGNLDVGVLLFYDRWGDLFEKAFYSKGDQSKLYTWVRTRHGDRRSVGFFIPFDQAFRAIMQFIRTDGARPTCIEWVRAIDLPEDVFPEPEVTLRDR
jgi:hypothetical protein